MIEQKRIQLLQMTGHERRIKLPHKINKNHTLHNSHHCLFMSVCINVPALPTPSWLFGAESWIILKNCRMIRRTSLSLPFNHNGHLVHIILRSNVCARTNYVNERIIFFFLPLTRCQPHWIWYIFFVPVITLLYPILMCALVCT